MTGANRTIPLVGGDGRDRSGSSPFADSQECAIVMAGFLLRWVHGKGCEGVAQLREDLIEVGTNGPVRQA